MSEKLHTETSSKFTQSKRNPVVLTLECLNTSYRVSGAVPFHHEEAARLRPTHPTYVSCSILQCLFIYFTDCKFGHSLKYQHSGELISIRKTSHKHNNNSFVVVLLFCCL